VTAIHIGTSDWSYPEWKGHFYPADLASGLMVSSYADRFNSGEVNDTFRRLPKQKVLKAWTKQVPPGSSFVIKASRCITHDSKLSAGAADPLAYLFDALGELSDAPCTSRVGPTLGVLQARRRGCQTSIRSSISAAQGELPAVVILPRTLSSRGNRT
jgi:uncharacterized protein YecE (DUF72 family)